MNERETLARLRWTHIKDRAAAEGVCFDLSVHLFEMALARGVAAEMIFPDKTPEDSAQWKRTLAAHLAP